MIRPLMPQAPAHAAIADSAGAHFWVGYSIRLESWVTQGWAKAEELEAKLEAAERRESLVKGKLADCERALLQTEAKLEAAEADSKTLNELGHALGRCYCTDQGCYTAEPEALMERAKELCAKEDQEWDYHGARADAKQAEARAAKLADALEKAKPYLEQALHEADARHDNTVDLHDYETMQELEAILAALADYREGR